MASPTTPPAEPRPAFPADYALVRDVVVGRTERLPELAERFACLPRIVRGLAAIQGGRIEENDALDVAQDAVLCAWSKLGAYAGDSTIEGWLYGIARFEVQNARRRLARRTRSNGEVDGLVDRTEEACVERAASEYDALYAALDRLEADIARVVRLKHFESLTFEAIGDRLSISPNTAKTRYYRGMTQLQQRLRGELGEERRR